MQELLPSILGPFGALVILCVVLYGAYVFVDKRLVPIVEKVLERHLKQIDDIVATHAAVAASHENDRTVWSKLLGELVHAVKELRTDLDHLRASQTITKS